MIKCRELTFVEVKETQPVIPEGAKGETKVVAADLQWTNSDVQRATTQLFDSITAQELLHNSASKRQALADMLKVGGPILLQLLLLHCHIVILSHCFV